ncbi:MAG: PP2C family serine/threonine-protein phosphatase [Nocardioides sp.]
MSACATCGASLGDAAAFCEACGNPVGAAPRATVPAPAGASDLPAEAAPFDDLGSGPISSPTRAAGTVPAEPAERRPCLSCGGEVGPDGYCEQCGTKQPSERDHFRETPAAWVAGVCDRGITHTRNEDAMALAASEAPGERAVLVVLDGVSSSVDSDVASLAGARAARDALRTPFPQALGTPQSRASAVAATFTAAVKAANDAIVATTAADSTNPASATFSVAVIEGTRLSVANIGDSRVYWFPDGGDAVQLTVDDSVAQVQMAGGMTRAEAENGPQGHAITRWLGQDAPDLVPTVVEIDLAGSGWVMNCSDGMWNYASEPQALADQIAAAGTSDPLELALALTAYANACGGRDNITVALARHNAPITERETDG